MSNSYRDNKTLFFIPSRKWLNTDKEEEKKQRVPLIVTNIVVVDHLTLMIISTFRSYKRSM